MDLPPQSLDLNIIEIVWDHLDREQSLFVLDTVFTCMFAHVAVHHCAYCLIFISKYQEMRGEVGLKAFSQCCILCQFSIRKTQREKQVLGWKSCSLKPQAH